MAVANWRLVNAVNLDTRPKAPHKALLHALVSFRNNESGRCDPSIDGLAERAGMSRSTAMRTLKDLRSGGMVAYEGQPNVRTQYELYPAPCCGDGVKLTPEPYIHHQDILDVLNYQPPASEPDPLSERSTYDFPEWDKALAKSHWQIAARRTGETYHELIGPRNSKPRDLERIPF